VTSFQPGPWGNLTGLKEGDQKEGEPLGGSLSSSTFKTRRRETEKIFE